MKKIILVATLSMLLFSCSKVKKGEFLITGTAKGIENGKSVVLQKPDDAGMQMVPIDTVKVKDGKFEFKGKITEPSFYTVVFPELNNGFPLIVENDEIKVQVYKDSIQKSKVSGTYNNDEMTKAIPEVNKLQTKIQALGAEFSNKNKAVIDAAKASNDTAAFAKLNDEFLVILKNNSTYYYDYIKDHPKSFISLFFFKNIMPFAKTDYDKINKLYDGLDSDLKKSKMGKTVKTQLDDFKKKAKK